MSDMSTFDNAELLQQALSARRNAYAPAVISKTHPIR